MPNIEGYQTFIKTKICIILMLGKEIAEIILFIFVLF